MSHATPKQKVQRNAGFSLVEVIIVVAVMSILATLTTPALIQFIQRRDEQTEQTLLLEIERALSLYAQARNELPDDNSARNPGSDDWATLLSSFTNLSEDQLRRDVWDNERAYISHTTTERFLDADVEISYITVHSRGINRDAENDTGIAVGTTVDGTLSFGARTASGWWSNQSNPVNAFGTVQPGGDDLMIKFTNYPTVIDNYNTTLERIRDVSIAIETYSKSKFNEALVFDNSLPDGSPSKDPSINTRIYYPPSNTQAGSDAGRYSPFVVSDMADFNFSSNRVYSRGNDSRRRDDMIQLMRLLGLPDSSCCNALERFDSGGESLEVPFYYFSNPRPRSATGCGARPGANDTSLPARLTTTSDSQTCG